MSNEFTSRLSKPQAIAVLICLPLHIIILPALLYPLVLRGLIGGVTANLLVYALGAVYMLLLLRRFFRRNRTFSGHLPGTVVFRNLPVAFHPDDKTASLRLCHHLQQLFCVDRANHVSLMRGLADIINPGSLNDGEQLQTGRQEQADCPSG